MTISRWAVLACVFPVLLSCNEATAPPRHPAFPLRDVRVEVELSASSVHAGSTVSVTTTIWNHSEEPVEIELNMCGSRPFRVATVSGADVPVQQHSGLCLLVSIIYPIAPGDSYQFTDDWNGHDANGTQLIGDFRVIGDPYPGYITASQPVELRWLAQ